MDRRWLILADDLTGAADCAIAFGRRGTAAAVGWGRPPAEAERPPVFAYDADSRGMSAEAAARRHGGALGELLGADRALFKKIDSTLRGQPAAETAAAIAHLKARDGRAFGVFAPAFPGTGRTTVDGRVRVAGEPLEEAEVWRRDHTYDSADLVDVLASAGVRGERIRLETVRSGHDTLADTLATIAAKDDVVAACDAETEDDLAAIAKAGLHAAPHAFYVGSAGLAHALAGVFPAKPQQPLAATPHAGGALIVVGSLAAASRSGARALVAAGRVVHAPVEPETLLNSADGRAALGRRVAETLGAGADVLVEIVMAEAAPDMSLGPRLAAGLADALQGAARKMSGFAATGGETAAAVLTRFGVNGIQLADEIEPGVSLGLTLGALAIPVATKAGAFGDEQSLIRIADRLAAIRQKGSFA